MLVMAILAIPFAPFTGKRSAVTGVPPIGIGVVYWTISGLFEANGHLSHSRLRSLPGLRNLVSIYRRLSDPPHAP